MKNNVYYPTFSVDPESIYGSGIVRANKFPTTDTTTSVITDNFPINKKKSPPIHRTGITFKPLDTNGYRVLKDKYKPVHKMSNYYYASQQTNKNMKPIIEPRVKDKIINGIKTVVNKVKEDRQNNKPSEPNDIYKLRKLQKLYDLYGDDYEEEEKTNNNLDTRTIMNYIKTTNKDKNTDDTNFDKNKMWKDDHYLYALEPRYTSVVNPSRAYTWMYPIMPNTDNYYVDNINSSPSSPIIVSNDSTNDGNYQAINLKKNMLRENFESTNDKMCIKNYNILYFIIIVLILCIYINRDKL
jgi:hypothetical protein